MMRTKYFAATPTCLMIVLSSNSFADDFNKHGYVALHTLHNVNLLNRPDHTSLVDLKKFESINASSSKNAASSLATNLIYASNLIYESILNKKEYENYDSFKSISADIEYFWIDFYDNKHMTPYLSCYSASRDFKDIWYSINVFDTETAYPSVINAIDPFNINLNKCIKASSS